MRKKKGGGRAAKFEMGHTFFLHPFGQRLRGLEMLVMGAVIGNDQASKLFATGRKLCSTRQTGDVGEEMQLRPLPRRIEAAKTNNKEGGQRGCLVLAARLQRRAMVTQRAHSKQGRPRCLYITIIIIK